MFYQWLFPADVQLCLLRKNMLLARRRGLQRHHFLHDFSTDMGVWPCERALLSFRACSGYSLQAIVLWTHGYETLKHQEVRVTHTNTR